MSNKKLFSLISEKSVHVGPKQKVIAANAFSELLEANEVLKKIKEDAERYRLTVAGEIEALKEQAQKEGYAAGFEKWLEHIEKLEEEIVNVQKTLERSVLPVAMKAAKKIVGRELEINETAIIDIVSNSLKSVAQHKKVTIWCSKADFKILDSHRHLLKNIFEDLQALSVRPREDLSAGSCIIETEGGIIDAKIEHLWERMEKAFTALMQKESKKTAQEKH